MVKLNKINIDKELIEFKESGNYVIEFDNIKNVEIVISNDLEVNIFYISNSMIVDRNINYRVLDNSKLVVNKFYNNKNSTENIYINLDGFRSSVEYYFSGISVSMDKYNMIINHNNKLVSSEIINHMIAMDNASIEFNIDSNVDYGNSGTIMNQSTKIINLGENRSVIKPNMNISEYDVKAKHGSVVGKFREEDIFYLMSRGISYNDSLKLLIKGFLLGEYKDKEFCDKINLIIDKYWR